MTKKIKKPTWAPENPYPEGVWPMKQAEFVKAVPDPDTRTAVAGFLQREGWKVAEDAIYSAINEKMERYETLLKATHALLKKCEEGPYVKNVLEETAFYDGTDCDGHCLMADIEAEVDFCCVECAEIFDPNDVGSLNTPNTCRPCLLKQRQSQREDFAKSINKKKEE